jgi:hypothetical protein
MGVATPDRCRLRSVRSSWRRSRVRLARRRTSCASSRRSPVSSTTTGSSGRRSPVLDAPAPAFAERSRTDADPWRRTRTRSCESSAAVCALMGHSDWVTACAFSPDGRRIVSASRDHALNCGMRRTARSCARSPGTRPGSAPARSTPTGGASSRRATMPRSSCGTRKAARSCARSAATAAMSTPVRSAPRPAYRLGEPRSHAQAVGRGERGGAANVGRPR